MKTEKKMSLFGLTKNKTDFPKEKIGSSKNTADVIRKFYCSDIGIYESFFLLLLNRANQTIGFATISQGGIVGTVVDAKIIAKYIVDSLASGIVIAHNHPSGNLNPSEHDITLTNRIKQVCQLLDTKLLDNVLLTEDSYYRFADEGKI